MNQHGHKEICLAEQKNVSVKNQRHRRVNKEGPAGEGLELVHGTKGSQSGNKRNRGAKQNKATGEGLELVRGPKEVSRETKETAAQNKTKPLEKAWN